MESLLDLDSSVPLVDLMDPRDGALRPLSVSANWAYLAEGNGNLVVRFVRGAGNASRFVLRIRKDNPDAICKDPEEGRDRIASRVAYSRFLTADVLGLPACYGSMVIARVSGAFLRELELAIDAARPASRKGGSRIYHGQPTAFVALTLDHLSLPTGPSSNPLDSMTLAVEIKPKWGFLPFSCGPPRSSLPPFVSDESYRTKRNTCRYCMHHFLKRGRLPAYCPLDLYSGQPQRRAKALAALAAEASSGGELFNNLRVFVDGHRLPGDQVHRVFEGVEPAFASAFFGSSAAGSDAVATLISQILNESRVLQRLAYHQQHMDTLDIEGVREVAGSVFTAGQALVQPDFALFRAALGRYLSEDETQRARWTRMDASEILALPPEEKVEIVVRFLASMTLKDVSVLVAVRRITDDAEPTSAPLEAPSLTSNVLASLVDQDRRSAVRTEFLGSSFEYTFRIVDADPKDIGKLDKWFELDRDIVRHWEARDASLLVTCSAFSKGDNALCTQVE
ncbi:inositol-pentakisphosphate 2-kinase [Hyaloraphidium curvatum]|nr:inositol-pentakisphosphate 2-kinase [Hyaloraphidium curvatum]